MNGLLVTLAALEKQLKDNTTTFTLFIPNDDAFLSLPSHRAKTMQKSVEFMTRVSNLRVIRSSFDYHVVYAIIILGDTWHAVYAIIILGDTWHAVYAIIILGDT